MTPHLDPAATAWLLAATALVLLMTPGLAIFYGGMVRSSGVLNMLMMSFIAIPLVAVAWLLFGYSLAFGDDAGGGIIGDLGHFGLAGIDPNTLHVVDNKSGAAVPELLFVTFQLTFAILT
ncbi:ammonia channel protein, partial [Streptomyces sp. NPDC059083]